MPSATAANPKKVIIHEDKANLFFVFILSASKAQHAIAPFF